MGDHFVAVLRCIIRKADGFMFVYRPPKSSCWGHSVGKDSTQAQAKLDIFLEAYFEKVDSVSPTTLVLAWKDFVLPKVEWPAVFQGPENQKVRQFLLGTDGYRVMFPMGIVFPLSTGDPTSFEFLEKFSKDAPFRMSTKHFMVGVVACNGKFSWRKPDAGIRAKLEEAVG